MKKQIYTATLLVAFSWLMVSCLSSPSVKEGEYLVEGTLSNVPDGAVLRLCRLDGAVYRKVAEDTLRNGRFSFHDTISVPSRHLAILSDSEGFPSTWLSFYVGSGKVTKIKGENTLFPLWSVSSDLPEQDAENKFAKATQEEWRAFSLLLVEKAAIDRKRSGNISDIQKKAYKEQRDSIKRLSRPIQRTILQKEIEVMRKEPVSPPWIKRMLYLASRIQYDENLELKEEARAFFAQMSDANKQTPEGRQIAILMEVVKKVGVGDKMADGTLFDLEGKEHHLAELGGKYILLDFWYSACGPCRKAVPEMKEIARNYADKLHIVSISSDSESVWRNASKELELDGLNWNEFKGNGGLAASYQVQSTPCYVMIDPKGEIVAVWNGYGEGFLKEKVYNLVK